MHQSFQKDVPSISSITHIQDHQKRDDSNAFTDRFNSKFQSVSPLLSDPNFKSYRCPYCKNVILQGNVQHLKMVCHHCFQYVNSKKTALL